MGEWWASCITKIFVNNIICNFEQPPPIEKSLGTKVSKEINVQWHTDDIDIDLFINLASSA